MKKKYTFEDYLNVVRALRAPGGCPWDSKQTHESLRPYMVEEAYEVLDGIRILKQTGQADNLCEELGDVLLQVLLHSVIAEEEGYFQIEDVIDGGCRKMIRRHPHVFPKESGQKTLERPDWDEIKRREKGYDSPTDEILSIPLELPSLLRMQKVYRKKKKIFGETHTLKESADNIRDMLSAIEASDGRDDGERIAAILEEVCAIAEERGVNAEQSLADGAQKILDKYRQTVYK